MQHKDIISTVLEHKYLFCSVLDLYSSSETENFSHKGHNLLSCSGWQGPFSLLLLVQERKGQQRKGRIKKKKKIRYFNWVFLVAFGWESLDLIRIFELVCSLDLY